MAGIYETLAASIVQNDGSALLNSASNAMDSYVKGVKARGDTLTQGFKDLGTGMTNMLNTVQNTWNTAYQNDLITLERETAVKKQMVETNMLDRDRKNLVNQTGFNSSQAYTKSVYDALNQNQELRNLGITNMAELTGLVNNPESIGVRAEILAQGDPDLYEQKKQALENIAFNQDVVNAAQKWEDTNNRFMMNEKGVLSPESTRAVSRIQSALSAGGNIQPEGLSSILSARDTVRQAAQQNIEAELSRNPYGNNYNSELAAGYAAKRKEEEAKREKAKTEAAEKANIQEWTPEQAKQYAQIYANLPADQQNAINQSVSFIERTQGKAAGMKYYTDILESYASGGAPVAPTATATPAATPQQSTQAAVAPQQQTADTATQNVAPAVNAANNNVAAQAQPAQQTVQPSSDGNAQAAVTPATNAAMPADASGYTTPNQDAASSPSLNTPNVFGGGATGNNTANVANDQNRSVLSEEEKNVSVYRERPIQLQVPGKGVPYDKDNPNDYIYKMPSYMTAQLFTRDVLPELQRLLGSKAKIEYDEKTQTLRLKGDNKVQSYDQWTVNKAIETINKIKDGNTFMTRVGDVIIGGTALYKMLFAPVAAAGQQGVQNHTIKGFKEYYQKFMDERAKGTSTFGKAWDRIKALGFSGSHGSAAYIRQFLRDCKTRIKGGQGLTQDGRNSIADALDAAAAGDEKVKRGLGEFAKKTAAKLGKGAAVLTTTGVILYAIENNQLTEEEYDEMFGILAIGTKEWEKPKITGNVVQQVKEMLNNAGGVGEFFTNYTPELNEMIAIMSSPGSNEEKQQALAKINWDNIDKQIEWLQELAKYGDTIEAVTAGGGVGYGLGALLAKLLGITRPEGLVLKLGLAGIGAIGGASAEIATDDLGDIEWNSLKEMAKYGRNNAAQIKNQAFGNKVEDMLNSDSPGFLYPEEYFNDLMTHYPKHTATQLGIPEEVTKRAQDNVAKLSAHNVYNSNPKPTFTKSEQVENTINNAKEARKGATFNRAGGVFGSKALTNQLPTSVARAMKSYHSSNDSSNPNYKLGEIKINAQDVDASANLGGNEELQVDNPRMIPLQIMFSRFFTLDADAKKKLNKFIFQNEEFKTKYNELVTKASAKNSNMTTGEINKELWSLIADALDGTLEEEIGGVKRKTTFDKSLLKTNAANIPGLKNTENVDYTKMISTFTQHGGGVNWQMIFRVANGANPTSTSFTSLLSLYATLFDIKIK